MNPTIAIIMGIPLYVFLVINAEIKKKKQRKNLILFPVQK